jgi:MamI restriction endonuclease
MKPRSEYITITDNKNRIIKLLQELVLDPRIKALEWSKITKQTPNMKIGYPGQHLASLITGIEGSRTGARGDDLQDGTEVKSCSRVDQLDNCKDCKEKVLRTEMACSYCGSTNINRMDDSKWLFGIKSEQELELLIKDVERIFLTIADYPNFKENDFETIRFQAFEIWTGVERHRVFATLMTNYYNKIYLEHKVLNANKNPAPKNFWPFSYQFYLCNPIKVFNCIVTNSNTLPSVNVDYLVEPNASRDVLASEYMPTSLLQQDELQQLIQVVPEQIITKLIKPDFTYSELTALVNASKLNKKVLLEMLPYIDEKTRNYLPLRDTDVISVSKEQYVRHKKENQ